MKYQVTVTRTEFALVDVEADSEEEAEEEAYTEATENYEGQCWETTSIDTEAKEQDDEDEELDPSITLFGMDKQTTFS